MNGEQFGPAAGADAGGGFDGDGFGGGGGEEMFADLGHFETGAIPVDAVLRQGKAIRTRRRVIGGAALALAAALTIAAPVVLARGSGRDVAAGSGPRITVNRPTVSANDGFLFSGTFNGDKWSLRVLSNCDDGVQRPAGQCVNMETSSDPVVTPVDLLVVDVNYPGSSYYFYSLRYSPETDFAVVTLSTGDQVTVPGIDVDSTYRTAWFPTPRATPITKIVAYGRNGKEIGQTPDWGTDASDPDVISTWYRPDGTTLLSAPNVEVAKGTTGGVDWHIESTMEKSGRCFVYSIGSVPATVCPGFGAVAVHMNNLGKSGPKDGVVVGEVADETNRVDVRFADGTVQHLTPVRASGHVFVGTYIPAGATVVSVTVV